jgi:hypothetical protein
VSNEPGQPKSPVRVSVWILVVALVLTIAFAVWLRVASYPQVVAPVVLKRPEPRFPTPTRLPPLVSWDQAARIAIEEVKKREGWSGKVGGTEKDVYREGFTWYVTVKRQPREPGTDRVVAIEGRTGNVRDYRKL